MARLYFMYNPETISRDYMNYLDQGALDPFNTVFQSGNLVAPPSMLNFSFELFFDRQEEAMASEIPGRDGGHGVLRPRRPQRQAGHRHQQHAPRQRGDDGQPRDITVVFSPEITVQGRPLNASVIFERFTHKMVPTRMRINLQMRVVYFGPMRDITTFVPETVRAMEAITYLPDPAKYEFDLQDRWCSKAPMRGRGRRCDHQHRWCRLLTAVCIEDFEDVEVTGAEAPLHQRQHGSGVDTPRRSPMRTTRSTPTRKVTNG